MSFGTGVRRASRRWAALGTASLAVAGALVVGGQAVVAPTAAAAAVPATSAPTAASDLPLPPLPLPPLPGTMRWRGEQAMERFQGKGREAPREVAAWGVDEASGKLVVNVVGTPSAAAKRFVADSDPTAVQVVPDSAPVRRYGGSLIGGQAIYGDGVRCSIGFTIGNRFGYFVVTAGHCIRRPATWSGTDRTAIGPAAATSYPTDDYSAIQVTPSSGWVPTPRVQSGPTVRGSAVAPAGAAVCRSGSTTGYRCGSVQAFNQTVNYGNGEVVSGLTRTNVCAEPGDSGGSFITPAGQAQGLTSGGSGTCTSGGTTYFQPINEVLQAYQAQLVTG